MPENLENRDIRIVKTRKMLIAAMTRLLEKRDFNQITVIDLCEEALVSRSTFYSHYRDKYDLLKHWLSRMEPENTNREYKYEEIEKIVNDFADNNKKTIGHLIENANSETYELLCDFIQTLLDIKIKKTAKEANQCEIVLSTVCCGGILNYLKWQTTNKFPAKLPAMNPDIFSFISYCQNGFECKSISQNEVVDKAKD